MALRAPIDLIASQPVLTEGPYREPTVDAVAAGSFGEATPARALGEMDPSSRWPSSATSSTWWGDS